MPPQAELRASLISRSSVRSVMSRCLSCYLYCTYILGWSHVCSPIYFGETFTSFKKNVLFNFLHRKYSFGRAKMQWNGEKDQGKKILRSKLINYCGEREKCLGQYLKWISLESWPTTFSLMYSVSDILDWV